MSDSSPRESWVEMPTMRVLEGDRCIEDEPIQIDYMPANLIQRAYGRLNKNSLRNENIGLFSAYMNIDALLRGENEGIWMPEGRPAQKNTKVSEDFLEKISRYFDANQDTFLFTPKFPLEIHRDI